MNTRPALNRIGLVACASTKLSHPAQARDLYTSQLFRKAAKYAELTCHRWFILSAKHGLLDPAQPVEPYDERLASGPQAEVWAERVRAQLAAELADTRRAVLVTLAGARYQTVLRPCQWPFQIPMKGLGIGQQLQWLTAQLAQLETATH
ncbi:DUF6884 domain-containing protein [Arthrobacter sp. MAHUQ-56]